jgi:hypothetical protein
MRKLLTLSLIVNLLLQFSACSDKSAEKKPRLATAANSRFGEAKQVGQITTKDIDEGSGIAASMCQADVYWTHNDANNKDLLFAIDLSGNVRGVWKVEGASNEDWEDISSYKDPAGQCFLYIADIGDNDGKRPEHAIYRLREPVLSANQSDSIDNPVRTERADSIRFNYGGTLPNAETLLVHPTSGDIYIITKEETDPATVFAIKGSFGSDAVVIAQPIAKLSLPSNPNGQLTGGDISPDGRHLVLMDYAGGYEFWMPDGGTDFARIFSQPPVTMNLAELTHGEGICYTPDGRSIIAIRDGKRSPIIRLDLKG